MDFLDGTLMGKPCWMWGLFALIVLVLLALDLGVLHRRPKAIGVKESLALNAFYIAVALTCCSGAFSASSCCAAS
jgi:tellurite resistance protein TerC